MPKPITSESTLVSTGTVDLEGANDVVSGVAIGPETLVLATLQEKKTGAALGLINLIGVTPLREGQNAFIAHLSTPPIGGQTILLAFATFEL